MKVWPMKTNYDNYLRAACEVHVCMSITVAFVLKGDLSHEIVHRNFYDWVLLLSGGTFVFAAGLVCVFMKIRLLRKMQKEADWDPDTEETSSDQETSPEKAAYIVMRFMAGLTDRDDLKELKKHLEKGGSISGQGSDSASGPFGEEGGAAPPPRRDRPQPEPEPEPHHGNDLEEPLFSS